MEEKIKEIIERYQPERRFALAIMQDIQREFNYIPEEAFALIKGHIGGSVGQLYAIATFYKALSLKPKGKHIIKVCDGTACHIRGSVTLLDAIKRRLGIEGGQTTKDGLFTLETVNCLGACAIAPVMIIGEEYFGSLTIEKLEAVLQSYERSSDEQGADKNKGAGNEKN